MLADALAQYLVWKAMKRWVLVAGSHESDKLLPRRCDAPPCDLGEDVQEKAFEDTGGARRPTAA